MNEPEEEKEERRAGRYVLAAVLLLIGLLVLLLLMPTGSKLARGARRAVFGNDIAGQVEAIQGNGEGTATLGGDIPDADALKGGRRISDAPIGRAPDVLGERKPGDEIRPGAAGTDDPVGRVGNSRETTATNFAGGNPRNSDRDSVDNPRGNDPRRGSGGGSDGPRTNSPPTSNALLLDDFSERLRQAGARSGDVQISLEWKNQNDLDLHVTDPHGEEIFYNNREASSGGILDVDMNVQPESLRPVENIYWPERGAPPGTYRVEVVHYRNHGGPDPTQFAVRVINKGNVKYYRGVVTFAASFNRSRAQVCTFTVR